jgi:hypothetical protein
MKKILLSTFIILSFFIQTTKASLLVETLDLKLNAANPSLDLKFGNFEIHLFGFLSSS